MLKEILAFYAVKTRLFSLMASSISFMPIMSSSNQIILVEEFTHSCFIDVFFTLNSLIQVEFTIR